MQLANEAGNDEFRVCVIEKAATVGGHILSGAVIEPRSLNELIPDWQEKGAPLNTPVKSDKFLLLSETGSFDILLLNPFQRCLLNLKGPEIQYKPEIKYPHPR